jgi:hypothetical protein
MIEIARVWMQLKVAALDLAEQRETLSLTRARDIARRIVMRECFDQTPLEALDYFAAALLSLVADDVRHAEEDLVAHNAQD